MCSGRLSSSKCWVIEWPHKLTWGLIFFTKKEWNWKCFCKNFCSKNCWQVCHSKNCLGTTLPHLQSCFSWIAAEHRDSHSTSQQKSTQHKMHVAVDVQWRVEEGIYGEILPLALPPSKQPSMELFSTAQRECNFHTLLRTRFRNLPSKVQITHWKYCKACSITAGKALLKAEVLSGVRTLFTWE